jgi:hypothetical protein
MTKRILSKKVMEFNDEFSKHYKSLFSSEYACIDRMVLNGYFPLTVTEGGFRVFWEKLYGNINDLDDAHLIRMAGRFSRRVQGLCKSENIPLIYCKPDEKKFEMYQEYLPKVDNFTGVFVIFVSRAYSPIFKVGKTKNGNIKLEKKAGFVNHYSFHIIDKEFGHLIIKMSGHPPFGAQIILNGHQWVEVQAKKEGMQITKEGNCFTWSSDADRLCQIADTYAQAKGRLQEVCDHWIYPCLWFGLDSKQQAQVEFKYHYSIYQCEYSQNFCFKRGTMLDQVYQNLIDLTRRNMDIPTIKTIFGKKHRPHNWKTKQPEIKVSVEKPEYNLTVYKIQFGHIVIKLYDKGERTLRAEIMLLNARDLKCKRSLENLPQIVKCLKQIMTNFLNSITFAHISFLDDGSYDRLLEPEIKGKNRLAGININNLRIRTFMHSLLALSIQPNGFTISDVTQKMTEKMECEPALYPSRKAWYDIKKMKAKNLVKKIDRKRRYVVTPEGICLIHIVLALFENIIPQTLAGCSKGQLEPEPKQLSQPDIHFKNINNEIKHLCALYGISLAA